MIYSSGDNLYRFVDLNTGLSINLIKADTSNGYVDGWIAGHLEKWPFPWIHFKGVVFIVVPVGAPIFDRPSKGWKKSNWLLTQT